MQIIDDVAADDPIAAVMREQSNTRRHQSTKRHA